MKKILSIVILVLLALSAGFVCVKYYSYVFAKTIRGQIVNVEKVNPNTTIVGSGVTQAQLYSFGVAIKDERGEIHTASSEDRQWAVATSGQCAEAKFFPYPPWELDKGGTYHGARLIRLYECGSAAHQNGQVPGAQPAQPVQDEAPKSAAPATH
ncbi:MAG: hypothetical protein H7222_12690 [Methylotenera sp.]|nr:hypothetical protein [Oligoflexia bacterium]